jgi:prophage regulatory protein
MPETYLSDLQVSARYGVHRSTPWRWTNSDLAFPKPIALTPGCTRWRLSDVEAWEARRALGKQRAGGRVERS